MPVGGAHLDMYGRGTARGCARMWVCALKAVGERTTPIVSTASMLMELSERHSSKAPCAQNKAGSQAGGRAHLHMCACNTRHAAARAGACLCVLKAVGERTSPIVFTAFMLTVVRESHFLKASCARGAKPTRG